MSYTVYNHGCAVVRTQESKRPQLILHSSHRSRTLQDSDMVEPLQQSKKMGWICRSVMVLHPPRLSPVPRSENTVLEKLICWNIKELLHRVGITLQVTDLKWDLSKSKRPKDILTFCPSYGSSPPPKLSTTPCSTDFNTDFLLFLVLSPVRDDIIGLDKAPPEPQKTSSCCFNRAAAINWLSRQLLN